MDELKQFIINKQLKSALATVGYKDADVGKVGEDKIFTNEEIKKNFLDIISQQDTFKPIINTITRLIETDRIVPVHIKVGLLNQVMYFFFKNKKKYARSSFSMAFFDFESRKIFVLAENIKNYNYWSKQEAMSLILLHELQHMTSLLFPVSFLRLHEKSLIKYFQRFFKLYFSIDISKEDSYKIIKWLHVKNETLKGQSLNLSDVAKEYLNLMWNVLKPYFSNTEHLKKRINEYFYTLVIYWKNSSMYSQMVHERRNPVYDVFIALKRSYEALNILKTDTLSIQELIFPGEIICIESEFNTQPRHFKLITQIR